MNFELNQKKNSDVNSSLKFDKFKIEDEDTKNDSRSEFLERISQQEINGNPQDGNQKGQNHYLSNSSIEGNISGNAHYLDQTPQNQQNPQFVYDNTQAKQKGNDFQQQQNDFGMYNNQAQQQQPQQTVQQQPQQQLQQIPANDSFSTRFIQQQQNLPLQQQSSLFQNFPLKVAESNEFGSGHNLKPELREKSSFFNPQEFQQPQIQSRLSQQQLLNDQQQLQKQPKLMHNQSNGMFNSEFQDINNNFYLNKFDSMQQPFETPQLNFQNSYQQQNQINNGSKFGNQDNNGLHLFQNNSLIGDTLGNNQLNKNPSFLGINFGNQQQQDDFQQKLEYNSDFNNMVNQKFDLGVNQNNNNNNFDQQQLQQQQNQMFPENQQFNQYPQQQMFNQNIMQQQQQDLQQQNDIDVKTEQSKSSKKPRKQRQRQSGKKKQNDAQKKVVQKVKKNLFRNFSRQFFDYLIDNWSIISQKLKKILTVKQYTAFTHHLNQQQQKQIVTKQNFHKIFFPYKNKFVKKNSEEVVNDTQTNLNKKIMRAIAFQFIKSEFLQTCLTSRISNWPIFYQQRYNIIGLLSSNATLY